MRPVRRKSTARRIAWIPELAPAPRPRQVALGIVASLLLHLLALVVLVLLAKLIPPRPASAPAPPPRQIELTIQPPPPEEEKILPQPAPAEPELIPLDPDGLAVAKAPPAQPLFESSENMVAASEAPAGGELPLPSQQGREKDAARPDDEFATQKAAVGPPAPEPTAEPVPASPPTPPEPPTPPVPTPPPPAEPAPAATPAPTPREAPESEFEKKVMDALKAIELQNKDEIALSARELTPTPPAPARENPAPATTPTPTPPPTPTPEPLHAMLTTPVPRAIFVKPPSYRREQEQTRILGAISNRGPKAVDAIATPLGKYRKQINDAIGSRWQYYVKHHMDVLALGSARVSFFVSSEGRVQRLRVETNTSNQSFADVCERAIREAEIPPPPPEALAPMRDGRLDYEINFTLYSF